MIFESLHSLVSHKRHYCKLRFTCKCEEEEKTPRELENSVPGVLQCSSCNQDFDDPWDLMEHVQVTSDSTVQTSIAKLSFKFQPQLW